jgi:hypothetical protein
LHAQNNFYAISNFTEQTNSQSIFYKKTARGPDLPGTGRGEADPAQIQRGSGAV